LGGDQPRNKAASYTGQHTHRINTDIHLMPQIGFESIIPKFEWAIDVPCPRTERTM
jgi:hypothetical protein